MHVAPLESINHHVAVVLEGIAAYERQRSITHVKDNFGTVEEEVIVDVEFFVNPLNGDSGDELENPRDVAEKYLSHLAVVDEPRARRSWLVRKAMLARADAMSLEPRRFRPIVVRTIVWDVRPMM